MDPLTEYNGQFHVSNTRKPGMSITTKTVGKQSAEGQGGPFALPRPRTASSSALDSRSSSPRTVRNSVSELARLANIQVCCA